MSIKIYNNKIMIGNYTLQEVAGGLVFDGIVAAEKYNVRGGFQGNVAGYTSAGGTPANSNVIDKFPFAVDSNALDVGDLTQARTAVAAGASSPVSGYVAGGWLTPGVTSVIDKFPFATNRNATNVGSLLSARSNMAGQSSFIRGYATGGYVPGGTTLTNVIESFLFTTDYSSAFDVGDLTQSRWAETGQSSSTRGYSSGGWIAPGFVNTIDKFPFAGEGNATDVGDLTQIRRLAAGQSSTTHGYASGGYTSPTPTNVATIDKFPFASDANATSVGSLSQARRQVAGQSSTISGYTSGGFVPPAVVATIDKFPFFTDSNATSVGSLSVARQSATGQQY
jgi:hypothetical protein